MDAHFVSAGGLELDNAAVQRRRPGRGQLNKYRFVRLTPTTRNSAESLLQPRIVQAQRDTPHVAGPVSTAACQSGSGSFARQDRVLRNCSNWRCSCWIGSGIGSALLRFTSAAPSRLNVNLTGGTTARCASLPEPHLPTGPTLLSCDTGPERHPLPARTSSTGGSAKKIRRPRPLRRWACRYF
jgi:hypothetical protein